MRSLSEEEEIDTVATEDAPFAVPMIADGSLFARAKGLVRHRAALILTDQVVVSVTNFSTGILIGRFCSKSELGLYMLGYSVLLFAIALQQMSISSPLIALWPRLKGERAAKYLSGSYSQQALFCAALSSALLLAAAFMWSRQPHLAAVLLCYAFAAPCVLFKEMFRRVCFSQMQVERALVADTLVGFVQVIALVLVARLGHMSAIVGVLTVAASTALLVLGWLLRGKQDVRFDTTAARDVFRQNWSVARWITGSQLLWAASLYAYPWLISHMKGTAAAGVWAACFGINALGNPLMLGLQNFIEPKVSHAYATGGPRAMRRTVWLSTAVLLGSMLTFTLFIAFAGSRAVVLLYGPRYAGTGMIVTLITLSYALGAAGFALSCGFFVSDLGRLDMRISWVYPIALLLLGVPLVERYGPLGAGLSLVLVNAVSTLLRALQFAVSFQNLRLGEALPTS